MSLTCDKYVDDVNMEENYDNDLESRVMKTIDEGPNLTLDNVLGLEDEKSLLKASIAMPFVYSMGFEQTLRRFLFFGPSGTGKTYLARAVAGEAIKIVGKVGRKPLTFFSVSPSDLKSEWLGESEKLIAKLFSLAKSKSPSLIFLDNIESLFMPRPSSDNDNEWIYRVKAQLKREIDEMRNEQVFFIAAANSLDDLDGDCPFLGRFQKLIYVQLPDKDVRTQMFDVSLLNKDDITREDILRFVELTRGFTSDEISYVCENATNVKNVYDAIKITEPTTSTADITRFNNFAKKRAGWEETSEYSSTYEPSFVESLLSCAFGMCN